ncbi:MAG TPA: metallophosphoesterase family protein [bacterium]|nr:metallophosphoesterase family protein [bacterium]
MRYALLSDIHSNWEALETAVGHAREQQAEAWIVLGDTVGYGANPNECFEWVVQNAGVHVIGNHDKAVVDAELREWFNDEARAAIEWTAEVMKPELKDKILTFPFVRIEKGFTVVHSSLDEPEKFFYVMNFHEAIRSFVKMENPICFIGHTHIPSCFCAEDRTAKYMKPGVLQLEEGKRYILNPGSVGQPRDRDPKLSYGIFDEEKKTFEFIRLKYDNKKAADKIRKAGLPRYLADRLL